MVFDWVDIIISLGIVQGVFLIFTLQRIKDRNSDLNKSLVLLLSATTFMLLGRLLYFQMPIGTFDRFALIFDTVIFLFGPIIYNFSHKLLFAKKDNQIRWSIHLVPAIVHLSIALFLLIAGQEYFIDLARKGYIGPYYLITEVLAILSNFGYIVACFYLIKKFKVEEKRQFSFEQSPQHFLNYFLLSCLILVFVWLASVVNFQLRLTSLRFINYDTIWSIIPLLTYVVGYYMQKQPALFRVQNVDSPKTISQKRLSPNQIEKLKMKLDDLINKDKIFLNNELTLPSLAESLEEKPNDVSWLLNECYNATFYDFINQHRVEALLVKLDNNEHQKTTLLGLAFDCGFNSKSTFNKAFKKYSGKTPSEYINEINALRVNKKISA